jgi:hypothetical protein
MNTNIIEYLMKVKKMTQVEIAGALNSNSDDPDKKGITQAAISKWRKGFRIPPSRQIELLKLAGLYWKIEAKDNSNPDDSAHLREVDSRWNVLVKSETNEIAWMEYIDSLHTSFEILNPNGEHIEDEYLNFLRTLLVTLNSHGFEIPAFPPMPFRESKLSKDERKRFTNFFRLLLLHINILQLWCIEALPRKNFEGFLKLYTWIPNIAIAQTIKQSSSKNIVPLSTDIAQLEKSIEITENITEVFITDWLAWALNNSYPLIKENFAELSINSSTNNEEHEIVDSRLKKISHGEQKILEGIERNEKLLNEILKRLDEK